MLRADWRSELTPVTPGPFPLPAAVTAKYHFGWSGLTAGRLTAKLGSTPDGKVVLDAEGKSTGLARALWRLDVTHHAVGVAQTLRPLSLQQKEIYSAKTVTTDVQFSPKGAARVRKVSVDAGKPKTKRTKLPEIFDLQTALLFARSQPLNKGQIIRFAIMPAVTPYLATVKVLGTETLSVEAGKFNCIKCDLRLQIINDKLELRPHTQFKRGTVWVSNDARRLLIKASVEIFVGSVWAELDSANPPAAP